MNDGRQNLGILANESQSGFKVGYRIPPNATHCIIWIEINMLNWLPSTINLDATVLKRFNPFPYFDNDGYNWIIMK